VAELVAVFQRRHTAEEGAAHELLGDRRSALRKERGAAYLVVASATYETSRQHPDSDLPQDSRQAEVVDPVVGKEALVSRLTYT
jgi:hypothetical protein